MSVVVLLSPVSSDAVTFRYTTADVSAAGRLDYLAETASITIPPTTLVVVRHRHQGRHRGRAGRALRHPDRGPCRRHLRQRKPARGWILNDDGPPTLFLLGYNVTEGNVGSSPGGFSVCPSHASLAPVTFSYTTADDTAIAGSDYLAVSGTGTIDAGQTLCVSIPVSVIGDIDVEPNERFYLIITSVSGAILDASRASPLTPSSTMTASPPSWSADQAPSRRTVARTWSFSRVSCLRPRWM